MPSDAALRVRGAIPFLGESLAHPSGSRLCVLCRPLPAGRGPLRAARGIAGPWGRGREAPMRWEGSRSASFDVMHPRRLWTFDHVPQPEVDVHGADSEAQGASLIGAWFCSAGRSARNHLTFIPDPHPSRPGPGRVHAALRGGWRSTVQHRMQTLYCYGHETLTTEKY